MERRREFCKYVIDNGITGDQIFFTDEKLFICNLTFNISTEQIRLTSEIYKKYMEGGNSQKNV